MTDVTTKVLRPGDLVAAEERVADLDSWNRFAAVNDEFVAFHMSDEAGRALGFPTAIGMGNLLWSQVHRLLERAAGPSGRVNEVALRFHQPALRGTTVSIRLTVGSAQPYGPATAVDVLAEDSAGRIIATGTALIRPDLTVS